MQRQLNWKGCYNVRDIGGYPAVGGKYTCWRRIIRADNIANLTEEGCDALYNYGVRTIIDLRFRKEIIRQRHPFAQANKYSNSITYHHMPIRDELNANATASLSAASDFTFIYSRLLDWGRYHIANIVTRIADSPPGGVVVHCQVGKDRTGVLVAVLLSLVGVPHMMIAEDYGMSAVCLNPLYESALSRAIDSEHRKAMEKEFSSDPLVMMEVLGYLDNHHGGARSYLMNAGVREQTLNKLVSRMVGD